MDGGHEVNAGKADQLVAAEGVWVDSNYRPHAYQAWTQSPEWAHSARQISENLGGSRNLQTSANAV